MKKYGTFASSINDLPHCPVWAIMTTQTFHIVESKEAQRNGYYNRDENGIKIEYFDDEQEWKDEIVRRKTLAFVEPFFACKIIPASIQTTFNVSVNING